MDFVHTKSTNRGVFGISRSQRAHKIKKQGFRDCQRARKETLDLFFWSILCPGKAFLAGFFAGFYP